MATDRERFINPGADGTGNGTTNALTGTNSAYKSMEDGLIAEFAVTPNLVTSDIRLIFTCEGTTADSDNVNFTNHQFTTDATRYILFRCLAPHRHPGSYSTSHYRHVPSSVNSLLGFQNINCHVEFEGIQFNLTAALSGNPIVFGFQNGGTLGELHLRKCILRASGTGTPSGSAAITGTGTAVRKLFMSNCVVFGGFFQGVQLNFLPTGSKVVISHCTFNGIYRNGIQLTDAGSGKVFLHSNIVNTLTSPGQSFLLTSTTATSSGNYTADAFSPQDATYEGKTFSFVDAANGDLHLTSDNGFYGQDLSANADLAVTDDIDGQTRTLWHAGADEFVVLATNLYIVDQADGSGGTEYGLLQVGGSAPSSSVGPGWEVGTVAVDNYALMRWSAYEVDSSFFGATAQPAGAPNAALGDGFRTANPLNGRFAAGNWVLTAKLQALTYAGGQDGRLRFRLWKSPNADMSGATEITSGAVETDIATDLLIGSDRTVTATVSSLPEVVFNNEYLFLQLAWRITGVPA